MDQDVNLTEPTFLDGPMVDNDFFESLMCIDERMLLPTAFTECCLFTYLNVACLPSTAYLLNVACFFPSSTCAATSTKTRIRYSHRRTTQRED
jgi:hypothetical protein